LGSVGDNSEISATPSGIDAPQRGIDDVRSASDEEKSGIDDVRSAGDEEKSGIDVTRGTVLAIESAAVDRFYRDDG
jgi:hypothetical protein